jgi:hypothetical protein
VRNDRMIPWRKERCLGLHGSRAALDNGPAWREKRRAWRR